MAASRELAILYERLAAMEKRMSESVRMGTVSKSEAGKVQVNFGNNDVGTNKGHETPFIRTGRSGVVNENIDYAEGENVIVIAQGGNLEHAVVIPAGDSADKNPLDKNAGKNKKTGRIRKTPQQSNQQQGQDSSQGSGGGSYKNQENNYQKREDSDDDHQWSHEHDRSYRKVGKSETEMKPDFQKIKNGNSVLNVKNDEATLMVGDVGIKIKNGKIYLIGEVLIGSEDAGDRVATEKTRDSFGGQLQQPFATKAKAK